MGLRQPGEVLGERYRLIRPLGQGGMGSVWHAEHLSLNAAVALKVIETPAHPDPAVTERFLREARLAAALRSPHVVQIFDYGVDGQTPYIAMELLEGESLAERLDRVGRLSTALTARVVRHVARAIARAHDAGIIHRDLKPENVFIVRNDDEEIFKVFDFGIAKVHGSVFSGAAGAATRTGSLLGTPSHMSPEQAEGVNSIDHRTDIWALGVIAYRCLLGRLPFSGESVAQLLFAICTRPLPVPSQQGPVPEGFDAWFARACARDREQRFDSAKRASVELSRLLGDDASLPDEASSPAPRPPPPAFHSTTSQIANSEVASSSKAKSSKRVAVPILIALTLLLAAGVVPRIRASLQRQGPERASAALGGLEQAAFPLAPQPEPALRSRPPEAAVPTPPNSAPPAQHPGLPAGVRLSKGVNVVPSLPRAPVTLPMRDVIPVPDPVVERNGPAPRPSHEKNGKPSAHRARKPRQQLPASP